ncbi:MAG TPA: tetratricopeptide repeat protein [Verrucomicrobiota bacterium]|nr:tetratricopeptide repeat protein [Verrucomicrobiota bacterium]
MAEPLTMAAFLAATGVHIYYHVVGGAAYDLVGNFIEHWREAAMDPQTGLPRNHDLREASEASFQAAVQLLLLELAGRIDPKRSWLTRWAEKGRWASVLAKDLFAGTDQPHRQWLDAFRTAVGGRHFKSLHNSLNLSEDQMRECFKEANLCMVLGTAFADRLLEWTRFHVTAGTEHPDFENLVRNGWRVDERAEANPPPLSAGLATKGVAVHHLGADRRITLAHAYCLFFREHVKRRPEVFRIFTADTLNEMLARLDRLGGEVKGELTTLRAGIAAVATNLPNSAQFGQWLTPQLGAIQDLLEEAKAQLDDVARSQLEMAGQQAEILVAITTVQTELRRGHPDARAAHEALFEHIKRLTMAFQRVERRLFGLPLVRPSVPHEPEPGSSDLWIIEAKYRSIDLVGREAEMDALWQWVHGEKPVSVRLITGDAGAGKTRLAFELIWRLAIEEGDAWQAGRLISDDLRQLTQDRFSAKWEWDRPTLVMLDYARASHDALARLLTELARRAHDPGLHPFRLILLERTPIGTQNWLETLFPLKSTDGGPRVRELFDPPAPVPLPAVTSADLRRGLFAATLQRVARFQGRAPLPVPEAGADVVFDGLIAQPEWRDPLTLMMAALVAHQRQDLLAGRNLKRADLAFELADAEGARLVKFAGRRLPPGEECLLRHVAGLTVLAGGLGREEVQGLADTEADLLRYGWDQYHRRLGDVLATAWPGAEGSVAALQPDIVAEAFVLRNLAQRLNRKDGIQAVRRLVKTHERTCAGLILRAFHNFQSNSACAETLAAWAQALVDDGLANRDFALLAALDDSMPRATTALRHVAARVTGARLRHLKDNPPADPDPAWHAELARLAGNLGVRLSEAGRRSEALAPAQEAVELYRALARQNPDAFQPDLASALNTLANRLSELGRRSEALAPAQEAVELYRALARQNPDAFQPYLAGALNNLANRLSELGRRSEALAPAQEAVELRRALARQNPDAFQPALAMSLNTLATRLSELGRRSEALAPAQEAVELRRALAEENPDAFQPDLAMSLNNLANQLSDLGRRSEALAPAQEAVELYRALARQNPDAFQPYLASALNNLAALLSELGRRSEALAPAQEAVELRRALARQNPDAFQPDLAGALNNLAALLSKLGRRSEALAPAQEAVELYRALARQNPDAFQPYLAGALNNLANRLSELGRRSEALAPAQEAVELYRALARQNPDAFQPYLAGALNNLANRLSELGRRSEALAPAQEAVELYRALARQNPDAFQPYLARALVAVGQALEGNDRGREALVSFAEAVRILTPHFQALPDAHLAVMGWLAKEYERLARALNQTPEAGLLEPVVEIIQRLNGHV